MFNDFKLLLRKKYTIILTIAVINLLVAYFYIKLPFSWCSDFETYREAVSQVDSGACGASTLIRLLTMPASLLSAIFFSRFTGSLERGFMLINVFFYIAIAIVFYKLVFEIWKDKKISLISSVLFQSNYWLFSYCAALSADTGGFFFMILTSLFSVKYYFERNKKYFYFGIISSVVGLFFKEFGALGMISLGMVILISPKSLFDKIKEILEAAILFIIFPIIYHVWFYFNYNFSYFNWYDVALSSYVLTLKEKIITMIKVFGWLYLAGWPIFLFSLFKIKKYFTRDDYKIVLALLPASLAFFAWPIFMQRTAFVLVPWLAICSGFGLSKLKNNYTIAIILIIYTIVGYNTEILMKLINMPF